MMISMHDVVGGIQISPIQSVVSGGRRIFSRRITISNPEVSSAREYREEMIDQTITLFAESEMDLLTTKEAEEMRELEEMARRHEEEESARAAMQREVA